MIKSREKKYLRYIPPYLRRRYVTLKKYCGYTGKEYSLQPFENCDCVFVHIPKTGGVSVAKSLFGNLGAGHCTVKDYRFLFGSELYDSKFTFTFVRHPFSRLASAYNFLKQGGITERDQVWAEKNISKYTSINEFVRKWVRKENVNSWLHFREQSKFLEGKKELDVDFVGKTEKIKKGFEKIKEMVKPEANLNHLNKSKSNGYENTLDKESKKIIRREYQKDFELFGYS